MRWEKYFQISLLVNAAQVFLKWQRIHTPVFEGHQMGQDLCIGIHVSIFSPSIPLSLPLVDTKKSFSRLMQNASLIFTSLCLKQENRKIIIFVPLFCSDLAFKMLKIANK